MLSTPYSITPGSDNFLSTFQGYCSSQCYAKSTHFKKQLLLSPLWLREEELDKLEEESTFQILGDDDDAQLHGLVVNITGLELTDKDKEKESTGSDDSDKEEADKIS